MSDDDYSAALSEAWDQLEEIDPLAHELRPSRTFGEIMDAIFAERRKYTGRAGIWHLNPQWADDHLRPAGWHQFGLANEQTLIGCPVRYDAPYGPPRFEPVPDDYEAVL